MTETRHVMLLEENAAMRNFLYACVQAAGYDAVVTERPQDALRCYRASRPSAVILSLSAPRSARALRMIAVLHAIDPKVPLIVISGDARPSVMDEAITRGASTLVKAPFDEADVQQALARALNGHRPTAPAARRRDRARDATRPRLVGSGAAMSEVREFIARAAATDLTVLIRGENGTGKTLVAREIVSASTRWDQPFVKVNCARHDEQLDADLLALAASRRAPAVSRVAGTFASAAGGTLFLNRVSEMSASMQAAVLETLQEIESARLQGAPGGVRVIASSGVDIERAVAEGRLREELFFRLNVLSVQLPPLRERREDIPELASYFLGRYAIHYQVPVRPLSDATMRILMDHDWPGNVRELENVVRRFVLLGSEDFVTSDIRSPRATPVPALATGTHATGPAAATLPDSAAALSLKEQARQAAREVERALILRTLEQTHWNRKEAAALLGISYKALLKKIKECDLQNT